MLSEANRETREELVSANQQLLRYAEDLSAILSKLKQAKTDLQEAYIDTINRLVLMAEFKDDETGDHIVRISHYCTLIAKKMGMSKKDVQSLFYAAPMHDVGKVGIPDGILLKPGKLTPSEYDIMKTHTIIGGKILSNSKSEILRVAYLVAISHHEKWDGSGYPRGIKGEEIPLVGRIVALADVFDALTSRRPYKEPYPLEVALEIIKKERGRHFDPKIVDIFMQNIEEIKKIREEVAPIEELSLESFKLSERDLALLQGEGE